jgi:hypothetical protein
MSTGHIQSLIISRQEARKRLDASFFSLERWHKLGHLRGLTCNGRVVAYVRKDGEAFARNQGARSSVLRAPAAATSPSRRL